MKFGIRRFAAMENRQMSLGITLAWALILIGLFAQPAQAHAPRENYIWINVEADHILGRFEINKNDLENKLNIDVDKAGSNRLEGVQATAVDVQAFLTKHFTLHADGQPLSIQFLPVAVFEENPDFLQYPFRIDPVPASNRVDIENRIFMTPEHLRQDRLHRSLVVIEYNKQVGKEFGHENTAHVFGPGKFEQTLDLVNPDAILGWRDFFVQGIWHIVYGLDHVLFIIVLLLTTVLRLGASGWEPVNTFRSALWNTLKIVTIFTIAHSITLSLAALNLVNVNAVLVESIIALSIVAIAVNNIFPRYSSHAWILVFCFGLFHGLGFASVMGDLAFRNVYLERILILFNVGVEAGQFAIVLLVFPVLYLMRRWQGYQSWVVTPLSALAALIALVWTGQRVGLLP